MTITIPTSGPARRRAKAVRNRRHVHAQENDRAVAAGGLPVHWTALDTCPCGRISWLEEGATDEDHAAFNESAADHASYCEVGA